jgi:hypothetical protein
MDFTIYHLVITNNERYIKKNVVIGLAIALGLIVSILSSISFAVAQVASIEITSPANGKPYGGAPIGKLDLYLNGDNIRFVGKMNSSPQANKVFEGWLVDAGNRASNYKLSLGEFNKTQILDFVQNMINPYTYSEFQVTQEPFQDLDPKPSSPVAGAQLPAPFGQ